MVAQPEDLLEKASSATQTSGCGWFQLPTLTQLEGAMRRTKCGTAFFEDGIPTEILHYGAGALAKKCFPLLLKHFVWGTEPLLFKGGTLVQAYKGRGPSDRHESYRSLLISSTIGKLHHRLIRQQLMEHFQKFALPPQLGGLPHRSVTQAAHIVHLFLEQAWARGHSTAVLFVDIQQAFYRVLRQHAIKSLNDTQGIQELFATLSLGEHAFEDFVRYSSTLTALEQAEVPEYLQHLMADAMNDTWFVVKGSNVITQTRKGTRPGDSYADLLFAYTFAKLLKEVEQQMISIGCILEIRWSGAKQPTKGTGEQICTCIPPHFSLYKQLLWLRERCLTN